MPAFSALTENMISAALAASEAIMTHYAGYIQAERKADGSPVTAADAAGEAVIIEQLKSLNIPVLGEESVAEGVIPELGNRFFVVDPLDGTKEFIKRNGEFTVNIALVEDNFPTHGVIIAPALNAAYVGCTQGAFKGMIESGEIIEWQKIVTAPEIDCKIVASRSHAHGAVKYFLDDVGPCEDVSVGSSLKFCLLAEGAALHYPRFTPTCEWDIAAGHAILHQAGGALVQMSGEQMNYGKVEDRFLNPFFAAAANLELAQFCAQNMRNAFDRATS